MIHFDQVIKKPLGSVQIPLSFTNDDDDGLPDVPDVDDIDDGIDEMNELDADEREEMLADTAAVRQTVTKVCVFMFIHL